MIIKEFVCYSQRSSEGHGRLRYLHPYLAAVVEAIKSDQFGPDKYGLIAALESWTRVPSSFAEEIVDLLENIGIIHWGEEGYELGKSVESLKNIVL